MDMSLMWLLDRLSKDYVKWVKSFIEVSKEHLRWNNKTRCPCRDYQNARFNDLLTVECHFIRFGFSRSYQRWIFHGEEHETLISRQNDVIANEQVMNTTDDDSLNEVIDVLNDACGPIDEDINLEESTIRGNFDNLFNEASKELYSGCKKFMP